MNPAIAGGLSERPTQVRVVVLDAEVTSAGVTLANRLRLGGPQHVTCKLRDLRAAAPGTANADLARPATAVRHHHLGSSAPQCLGSGQGFFGSPDPLSFGGEPEGAWVASAIIDTATASRRSTSTNVVSPTRVTPTAPVKPSLITRTSARPRLLFVGQGRKVGYTGDEAYRYDPLNYLMLAVPIPAESEAFASPEEPVLITSIDLDATTLGEMLLEMDERPTPFDTTPRGISSTPMTEELVGAVIRLLESFECQLDGRLFGPMAVRQILYRVLRGEQGGALRALAGRDDHFARIARVLRQVHAEFAKPLTAEEMARRAGMSNSVFHHLFKLMTACSPLQYLKRIRLDHANRLMTHDGHNANSEQQGQSATKARRNSAENSSGSSA